MIHPKAGRESTRHGSGRAQRASGAENMCKAKSEGAAPRARGGGGRCKPLAMAMAAASPNGGADGGAASAGGDTFGTNPKPTIRCFIELFEANSITLNFKTVESWCISRFLLGHSSFGRNYLIDQDVALGK